VARTFVRQSTQVRNSDLYDDTITPSETAFETDPTNIEEDLNNIRSQIKLILGATDWWKTPTASLLNVDRVSATDTTSGFLDDKLVATEGIQTSILNGGGDEDLEFKLDINGLAIDASPDILSDYIATFDASAGVHKKVLLNNLPSGGGGSTFDPNLILTDCDCGIMVDCDGNVMVGCG